MEPIAGSLRDHGDLRRASGRQASGRRGRRNGQRGLSRADGKEIGRSGSSPVVESRPRMDRRAFLIGTAGAGILAALPDDLLAQTATPPRSTAWDAGRVRHLLPGVGDTRMLIKASFAEPMRTAPTLRVGARSVAGRVNDTRGEFWQFDVDGLEPGHSYRSEGRRVGNGGGCG